jgi:hypothetical protein
MNLDCRQSWLKSFIFEQCSRTFVLGDLKRRREDILFDREQSYFPVTQQLLAHESESREELKKVDAEIVALRETLDIMETRRQQVIDRISRLKTNQPLRNDDATGPSSSSSKPMSFYELLCACPVVNCRGFIMKVDMKCGICQSKICKRCREVVSSRTREEDGGDDQQLQEQRQEQQHVCDPDVCKTVSMLAADTKSCPKCATLIFKISGCDQMFCTQCHSAFSWRTGELVNTNREIIHNPHYYDYIMQRAQERAAGGDRHDRGGGGEGGGGPCGGGGGYYGGYFDDDMRPAIFLMTQLIECNEKRCNRCMCLARIHRLLNHIERVTMIDYPQAAPVDIYANMQLRKMYLRSRITKEEFKTQLQRKEKNISKKDDIRQVLIMMTQVGTEQMNALYRQLLQQHQEEGCNKGVMKHAIVQDFISAMEQLREYVNESLLNIGKGYANKCPVIMQQWVMEMR